MSTSSIIAILTGNIVYPAMMTGIGVVMFVGTAAASAVGMDSALEFSDTFAAFGPFAKLFVASLSLSVIGIVWWAKSNEKRFGEYQRRLTEHKENNDKLTTKLFDAMQHSESEMRAKDEMIAELVKKVKVTDLD